MDIFGLVKNTWAYVAQNLILNLFDLLVKIEGLI